MEKGLLVDILLNIVVDLLACVELYLFMTKILLMKRDKRIYRWVIAGVIVVGCSVFSLVIPQIQVLFIAVYVIAVGICFDGKAKDILIRAFFAMFSLSCISAISYGFIRIVIFILEKNFSINISRNTPILEIIECIIRIIIIVLIGIYLKRVAKFAKWIDSINNSIYVLMGFLSLSTSALNSLIVGFISYCPPELENLLVIIQIVQSLAVYSVCIGLACIDYKKQCYEMDSLIKDKYLQASHEYFDRLQWQIDEMRRVKHDMNAHYFALDMHIKNKDLIAAQRYLDEIREHQVVAYSAYFTVGNELVDAVIYGMVSQFDDVCLSTEGIIGCVNISDYDLCTIFSNLVQNAAEALCNLNIDEKVISIVIRHYKNKILISISNRCDSEIDINNIGNYTTKKEKHLHGFGISNVRRIVDEYSGDLDFVIQDNMFYANITLNDDIL